MHTHAIHTHAIHTPTHAPPPHTIAHTHTHTYTYTYTYTYMHTHTHTHTHMHMHMHTHTNTHAHTHARIHMQMHTHMHVHTHTHKAYPHTFLYVKPHIANGIAHSKLTRLRGGSCATMADKRSTARKTEVTGLSVGDVERDKVCGGGGKEDGEI